MKTEDKQLEWQNELHKDLLSKESDCSCKVPDPRIKCSENGVYAYCVKCGKNYRSI